VSGLFDTMAANLAGMNTKVTDFSALTWAALMGQATSKAGTSVNIDTALKVSTVLGCTRVLAEGVAQLPRHITRFDAASNSETQVLEGQLVDLLCQAPNDWMTSFELFETMMAHAALCNNALAVKNVYQGQVRELLPVPWNLVQVERLRNYGLVYRVQDPYGLVGEFLPSQVVHLRGLSWDGVLGMDAVRLARESIGLSIATEEAQERLFANGARPGGLLSIDGSLGEEARERLKEASAGYSRDQAFKMMVLDKGATFTPFAMTGVDAQHLETRRYQVEEICRHFRVFPHMVGYTDKTATFASAESFFQGHVNYTLMPWLVRFAQVLRRDVLGVRSGLRVRFDVRELIRGDTMARAQFYASGITNGWLTRNDARRFEGLQPLAGLDEPLVPLNMGSQTDAAADSPEGQAQQQALAKRVKACVAGEVRSWLDQEGGLPTDDRAVAEFSSRVDASVRRAVAYSAGHA
jgi:HK97 family phage portal protein